MMKKHGEQIGPRSQSPAAILSLGKDFYWHKKKQKLLSKMIDY